MSYTRREFLERSLTLTGGLLTVGHLTSCAMFVKKRVPQNELVFFGTDPSLAKNGISQACVLDPKLGNLTMIPMPMDLPHGGFANPKNPSQIFMVEQGGPKACAVDLISKSVVSFQPNSDGYDFYGHGLFLPGGDYFVTTEVQRKSKEGRIAIRRASSFAVVDTIPSFGMLPHDIRLIHGGKVLVAANHGNGVNLNSDLESSVSFIDWKEKKLLHQIFVREAGCFASHLEAIADDEVIVACRRIAPKDDPESARIRKEMLDPIKHVDAVKNAWKSIYYKEAPIYWIKDGVVMQEEALDSLSSRMKNSLSLAFFPAKKVLGITHQGGNLLSFWDTKSRSLLKSMELGSSSPFGLAYVESLNVFVLGLPGGLRFIDAQTLELKEGIVPGPFGIHLGTTRPS